MLQDDCRQKAQQSTPPENAARKLRLALVAEGREPGEVSSQAVGVFSDGSGNGVVAVAAGGDGYRATPYLHEVMQVLEETKASGRLRNGTDWNKNGAQNDHYQIETEREAQNAKWFPEEWHRTESRTYGMVPIDELAHGITTTE